MIAAGDAQEPGGLTVSIRIGYGLRNSEFDKSLFL